MKEIKYDLMAKKELPISMFDKLFFDNRSAEPEIFLKIDDELYNFQGCMFEQNGSLDIYADEIKDSYAGATKFIKPTSLILEGTVFKPGELITSFQRHFDTLKIIFKDLETECFFLNITLGFFYEEKFSGGGLCMEKEGEPKLPMEFLYAIGYPNTLVINKK